MRAIADALSARFNPVAVQGEIAGFSRATSGHCYFTLKDEQGQVRCALFRRSAEQLRFAPRDGLRVVARGRLDVYGPRGDLQLIVETLQPAGQGALYEQFLRLRAQLDAEGLFDPARKRPLPAEPRHIGVVTSLGAAALRDVATALARRVPHIPVTVYPASVQGAQAPAEIAQALAAAQRHGQADVVLLVRGGGSLEDLWAFNDPVVVRAVAACALPVVCGVGHETDVTLADFAADLRAPTPTAAAELCAVARVDRLAVLDRMVSRLSDAVLAVIDTRQQHLDRLAQRLGRPSARVHGAQLTLDRLDQRLRSALQRPVWQGQQHLARLADALPRAAARNTERHRARLDRAAQALSLLDPQLVLERGYAIVTAADGSVVRRRADLRPGQPVRARLADGSVPLTVDREPPA